MTLTKEQYLEGLRAALSAPGVASLDVVDYLGVLEQFADEVTAAIDACEDDMADDAEVESTDTVDLDDDEEEEEIDDEDIDDEDEDEDLEEDEEEEA